MRGMYGLQTEAAQPFDASPPVIRTPCKWASSGFVPCQDEVAHEGVAARYDGQ